jgi:hypothetical protein
VVFNNWFGTSCPKSRDIPKLGTGWPPRVDNITSKNYQPYEIRAFKSGREFMKYLSSDLIKNSLIKLYGKKKYNKIIEWFKSRANEYTKSVK